MTTLKVLDVVRTKSGVLAVVETVRKDGQIDILYRFGRVSCSGLYWPDELVFVGSLADLESAYTNAQVSQASNNVVDLAD